MFLKVQFETETHQIHKEISYKELCEFISTNFTNVIFPFELTYIDSDGDAISLSNQEDLKTLFETCADEPTKIVINKLSNECLLKSDFSQIKIAQSQQSNFQETDLKNVDKICENKLQQLDVLKNQQQKNETEDNKELNYVQNIKQSSQIVVQKKQQEPSITMNKLVSLVSECQSPNVNNCLKQQLSEVPQVFKSALNYLQTLNQQNKKTNQVQQTKIIHNLQNINEEKNQISQKQQKIIFNSLTIPVDKKEADINSLLLQKLDSFIPEIVNKVKKVLLQQKIQQNINIHKIQCSVCLVQSIKGIRYKCTVCKDYNLCSLCQADVVHSHDMIKIRKQRPQQPFVFVKEKQQKKQQRPEGRPRGKTSDAEIINATLEKVKQILGDEKGIDKFVRQHYKEGADKIIDMWFNK